MTRAGCGTEASYVDWATKKPPASDQLNRGHETSTKGKTMLTDDAADSNALNRVRKLDQEIRQAKATLIRAILDARDVGHTWDQIGDAIGMSEGNARRLAKSGSK